VPRRAPFRADVRRAAGSTYAETNPENTLFTPMLRLALFLVLLPQPCLHAETFTVDTSSDASLSTCDDALPADCSLRGAIGRANATPAADAVAFNLPITDSGYQAATEHWTIGVGAVALPPIEAPLLIDGYTQPGAVANTNAPDAGGLNGVLKIEIIPATASAMQQSGIEISLNFFAQAASTIRGLVISRFAIQIALSGDGAHRVEGCYLGTTISGLEAAVAGISGRGFGIRLFGPGDYVIGGLLPESRNLISGMLGAITAFQTPDGIEVLGNLLGTDASGTQAIGHTSFAAISTSGGLKHSRIGGTTSAARNVISGNPLGAIYLSYSGDPNPFVGTTIEGNYIGTDVSGTRPLSNGILSTPQSSIFVFGGNQCPLQIGGPAPGAANLIAYGAGAGIQVATCSGVVAYANAFYGNHSVAIDLSVSSVADGVTANDTNDADEGGNRLQNHPALSLPAGFVANGGGASVQVDYLIDSAPANSSYPLSVHFYRAGCGGGGRELIASDTYGEADAQSMRSFQLEADGNVLPLVALAVDASGNTSEFSPMIGETLFADGLEEEPAAFSVGFCR